MKKILSTCCAVALVTLAGPAMAIDWDAYAINKIKYKNKGAYVATVDVRFNIKNKSGKTVTCKLTSSKLNLSGGNSVRSGKQRTYKLGSKSDFHFKKNNPKECHDLENDANIKGYVPEGPEIRARINIKFGETKTCHKKHKVKFYYHPDGGTVTYSTTGTTLNNNNCLVQSNGGVLLKDVQ